METAAETILFAGLFLSLPPVLLLSRFLWQRPSWWVIIAMVIVVGWATWFLAVVTHFDALSSIANTTERPDPTLFEQAGSDGGPLVFAAFLGWLIALTYALAWWAIFSVASFVRRVVRRMRKTRA